MPAAPCFVVGRSCPIPEPTVPGDSCRIHWSIHAGTLDRATSRSRESAGGRQQATFHGWPLRRCIGPCGRPLNGGVELRPRPLVPTTDKAAEARPLWPTGPRLRSTAAGPTCRPLSCRGPRSTSISSARHRKARAGRIGERAHVVQVHGRRGPARTAPRARVDGNRARVVHAVRTSVLAATVPGAEFERARAAGVPRQKPLDTLHTRAASSPLPGPSRGNSTVEDCQKC